MTEAPKTSESTPLALVSPWLDIATRLGALMLGTLYVVGLLIVNIEMASYGLFSMGLARAEYILVGTTWAALAAFNCSMTLQSLSVLLQGREHGTVGTLKAWARAAWALVLVLFAPVSTLGAIYVVNQWITGPSSAVARVDWWLFVVQMVALEANVGLLAVAYRGLASLSGGVAVRVPPVPRPAAPPPSAQPPEPGTAPVPPMLPSWWSKLGDYGYGTFHFTIWLILALWLYAAAAEDNGLSSTWCSRSFLEWTSRVSAYLHSRRRGFLGPFRCSWRPARCISCWVHVKIKRRGFGVSLAVVRGQSA